MPSLRELPLVRHARREAIAAFGLMAASLVYTCGVYRLWGYERPIESLTFVLGFPDWVFWGVMVPWVICIAASTWIAVAWMRDDDLGGPPRHDDV